MLTTVLGLHSVLQQSCEASVIIPAFGGKATCLGWQGMGPEYPPGIICLQTTV